MNGVREARLPQQVIRLYDLQQQVFVTEAGQQFELATAYTAGLCSADEGTRRFFDLLTGNASAALRTAAGFEF